MSPINRTVCTSVFQNEKWLARPVAKRMRMSAETRARSCRRMGAEVNKNYRKILQNFLLFF